MAVLGCRSLVLVIIIIIITCSFQVVDLSLLPGIWLICFVVFADYGFDNNAFILVFFLVIAIIFV